MELTILFWLNGEEKRLTTDAGKRVVDLLREDFGLTGAKECCGAGECGACTILLDGESRLSCLMLAAQLNGHHVMTIEGFARDRMFPIIQSAFVKSGAVQCGFCTPGMILAAADLLKRNPRPSREEITEGLSGNLCRCTGYQKIIEAVETVARVMKEREQ
jgi:carbon-monoxide dehydrogenase small subunit